MGVDRSCWAREASKRPRIEVVTENMEAISQSVVSALAPDARAPSHESSPRAFESLPDIFLVRRSSFSINNLLTSLMVVSACYGTNAT